jgi:3-oxoadipate enol-lactonase
VQLEAAARGVEALVRVRMLAAFSPPLFEVAPKLIPAIEAQMRETPLEGYLAQLDAAETHDVLGRLGEITAPTLVLAGARDVLVPRELTEEVARGIGGSQMVMLDTAHVLQFEEAETFNRTVLDFLAQH